MADHILEAKRKPKGAGKNGGFTLIELIVVIAVLAIIAALALPAFNNLREQSEEKVCLANQETLMRSYFAQAALTSGPITDTGALLNTAATEMRGTVDGNKVTGLCPDAAGSYTVVLSDDNAFIASISCSEHPGDAVVNMNRLAGLIGDPDSPISQYLKTISWFRANSSIDSTTPVEQGNFAGAALEVERLASEAGIDISRGSWRLYRWGGEGSYSLYYTDEDITELTPGTEINIKKWNIGGNGNTYSGKAKVEAKTSSGATYNIIQNARDADLTQD